MEIKVNTHGSSQTFERHGAMVDLCTAEETVIKPGCSKLVSLGVSMELPKGYFAILVPRSSTFEKHGIMMVNSVGVIDNGYCGDGDVWGFKAYAPKGAKVPAGVRIAQFMLVPEMPQVWFNEVDCLGNGDRGGFGSTGE